MLTTLPPPTPSQINAIGIAIDKVVQESGLHNENLEQRLEIKRIMENVFQHKLPGIFQICFLFSCLKVPRSFFPDSSNFLLLKTHLPCSKKSCFQWGFLLLLFFSAFPQNNKNFYMQYHYKPVLVINFSV